MTEPFNGTGRFRVERRIGSGGMGVVYEVFDSAWDRCVALKTIVDVDSALLLHLKDEFRALADISHPNLVQLYELIGDPDQCFFTMELIVGVGFREYVWRKPVPVATDLRTGFLDSKLDQTISPDPAGEATCTDLGSPSGEPMVPGPTPERINCPASVESLRGVLTQLIDALSVLHQNGKLHRDIKPGNLMVDNSGRLVLLDFGLVSDLRRATKLRTIAGTYCYMAPEQAMMSKLTPAADLYAVGATIYEALTGRPPFTGPGDLVLAQKCSRVPIPPGRLARGIPADLEELCLALLDRIPERRPSLAGIREMLGQPDVSTTQFYFPRFYDPGTLVGRSRQAGILHEACRAAQQGHLVLAFVRGESGSGKSALVNNVLDKIALDGEAMILRGRCYEQESVPYKGFDQLVDSVAKLLDDLEPERLEKVLPSDMREIAQVFPVLRRFENDLTRESSSIDPIDKRRKAVAALSELLSALAGDGPIILFIDDLQWGAVDTAGLLTDLLRVPNSKPMCVIGACRSEYPSRCLELLASFPFESTLDRFEIVVSPLGPDESRQLATMLLPESPVRLEWGEWIAKEARGNPFFISMLSTFAAYHSTVLTKFQSLLLQQSTTEITIEEVLRQWLRGLSDSAIRVLETIAVCGQPLAQRDALAAAAVDRDPSLLAELRAARLVRSTGPGPDDQVEAYHDRVRETVVARIEDASLRRCHRRLAERFTENGAGDPEQLAVHWLGAGESVAAGNWYAIAAERAATELAFDHACELYRSALSLAPVEDPTRFRLERDLASALANAGDAAAAAKQYLALCERAPVAERTLLLERAAYHFCASGHVEDGTVAFRTVLSQMEVRFPSTPASVILGILWAELRLAVRGLRYTERVLRDPHGSDTARVDALWSATITLSLVDIALGAYMIKTGLLAALRLGEPGRIARALSWAAAHESARGPKRKRRTIALLETCHEIAEQSGDARALMWYYLAAGASWMQLGEWRRSVDTVRIAEKMLRDHGRDVGRELIMAETFLLLSLNDLGEFAEMAELASPLLENAKKRGNLFAETNLESWVIPQVRLALDDSEGARRSAGWAIEHWSQRGYHLQHLFAMISKANAWLYDGEGEKAVDYLRRHWSDAHRSLLFRAHLPRAFSYHVRARAFIAAAEHSSDPEHLIREAIADARRLEREQAAWAWASALLVRAAAAHLRRQDSSALSLLRAADHSFVAADMGAYLASVRWCLSKMLGGSEAVKYFADANEWMRHQGIRNPEHFVRLHAPGFGVASGGDLRSPRLRPPPRLGADGAALSSSVA